MIETNGDQLLELLKRTGKKWGVGLAEIEGLPRVIIFLDDGQFLAMDQDMLQEAMPMLQDALAKLKRGECPKGMVPN